MALFSWGENEPIIKSAEEGGDRLGVFGLKVKNAMTDLMNTLNAQTWTDATTSSSGYMSAADKQKLNNVAASAEVNQNAFSVVNAANVIIGSTSKEDTLTVVAGKNISITADASKKMLTISTTESLFGSSNNPGGFKLETFKNGAPSASLVGTPEGSLTWGNSNVVTEASGNAATATTAAKLGMNGHSGVPMTFYWDGRNGQPSWVWGGDNGHDMYIYNPANFSVNYANSAGSCSGNAGSATKLATARSIGVSLSGQVKGSGSATFNGTGNITISVLTAISCNDCHDYGDGAA